MKQLGKEGIGFPAEESVLARYGNGERKVPLFWIHEAEAVVTSPGSYLLGLLSSINKM